MGAGEITFWAEMLVLAGTVFVVLYYIFTSRRKYKPYFDVKNQNDNKDKVAEEEEVFTVFLIGDAGSPNLNSPDPVLSLLKSQLQREGEKSSLFFLGDNVYPVGIPATTSQLHETALKRLTALLEAVKDFKGKTYFISGNHDWNKGRKGGWESILREQEYIQAFLGKENVFLPKNGCPGPVEVKLSQKTTAIIINTSWWVHTDTKPLGAKDGCTVDSKEAFFSELEAMMERNKDKKIIVIAHHPLYSNAVHGGNFHLKQHLFPLTELHKKAYVPLPLVGSLYPLYRKYVGIREDMAHPLYRKMRKRLIAIFQKHENLIYAAGHDHNLQYIKKGKQHYLVSGSGSKVHFVKQGGAGVFFTHAHRGFMRLGFCPNEVWLRIIEPVEGTPKGKVVFKQCLF